jgi:hypothetical protein
MRRLSPLLTILGLPFVIRAQDVYYQGDLAPLNIAAGSRREVGRYKCNSGQEDVTFRSEPKASNR